MTQGDYEWMDYVETDAKVEAFARGLCGSVEAEPKEMVAIYADTRADWLIAALGCFRNSITLVTLYTNLSLDGVKYGLNQTKVKTIITSQELLPNLGKILNETPNVKTIIYLENRAGKQVAHSAIEKSEIRLIPFKRVLELGLNGKEAKKLCPPAPEDVAILMYTSGSTGVPKGALLSHTHVSKAILSCLAFSCNLLGEERSDDEAFMAYLPLAHIFELTQEIVVLLMGIKVGYSGPNTLTDNSTMIRKGDKGDATVLKPSVIIAVPVILDRIYKAILAKIYLRGGFFRNLFGMFYHYRLFWTRRGFDTPVLNKIIFSKLKAALGGRINIIVGGGAPLSGEVHDFLRTCLCIRLAQGYGLTETTGGITLADRHDVSVGRVGFPLPDVKVRLENWEEGGYTIADKKGPRGEIIIGCPSVAQGYFEMPDETKENFSTDEKGDKWFRTGDIGQLMTDGTICIVDRKKDLVKLQTGEYVSLGKIESVLKVHPLVETVCAYAESSKNETVALVVPDEKKLREMAAEDKRALPFRQLCADADLTLAVIESIAAHAKGKLEKVEIPKAISLIADVWLPESGLVTAALKLKRKQIEKKYKNNLKNLYKSLSEE